MNDFKIGGKIDTEVHWKEWWVGVRIQTNLQGSVRLQIQVIPCISIILYYHKFV